MPSTPPGATTSAANVPRPRPVNAIRGWSDGAPPSIALGGSKEDATSLRVKVRDDTPAASLKSCRNATHA